MADLANLFAEIENAGLAKARAEIERENNDPEFLARGRAKAEQRERDYIEPVETDDDETDDEGGDE